MSNSKDNIFILDTNFIIEHKDNFKKVLEDLSDHGDVYVTQVSICERLYQEYNEMRTKYDNIKEFQKKYSNYANIDITISFEDRFKKLEKAIQNSYATYFNKILKYDINNISEIILDRAFKKPPPFSTDPKASDKGLKDSLLWLSIINYFKVSDECKQITFITSDKGFLNNRDALLDEFRTLTKKDIQFEDNSLYKKLLDNYTEPEKKVEVKKQLTITEKKELREEVSSAISNICEIEMYNMGFEDYILEKTFSISSYIDTDLLSIILDDLKDFLDNNVFKKHIKPSEVFGDFFSIIDLYNIPIENVEEVINLYNKFKEIYPEYLEQFLKTACDIINKNYVNEKQPFDEDLPF